MHASLSFTGLARGFGPLRVLQDVSGRVETGGLLLVTGRNGSGKSTLLRCLAGLLAPEAGTIDYREGEYREGETRFDIAGRRQRVGYVAPDLAFYEELSVAENLAFFARLRGLPRERADRLVARVGLPPARLAGALSSGMRQRLRWAFGLLGEPALLLADEPFQNLDAEGEALARELLAEQLEHGCAVVASPTALDLPRVEQTLAL